MEQAGSRLNPSISAKFSILVEGAKLVLVLFLTWMLWSFAGLMNRAGKPLQIWVEIGGALITMLQPLLNSFLLLRQHRVRTFVVSRIVQWGGGIEPRDRSGSNLPTCIDENQHVKTAGSARNRKRINADLTVVDGSQLELPRMEPLQEDA